MTESTAAAGTPADAALVRSLGADVLSTLRPLLEPGQKVALVDFPDHGNVGDTAIWLGELACLRDLGVGLPCYSCDLVTYSRRELGKAVGGGTILLSGGGNLGDLWPTYQAFRETVIRDFPENRVIQLPQSIHFRSADALARAREVFTRHRNLTLLVRDRTSLEIATSALSVPAFMCPDMAFCLGPLKRRAQPAKEIVWLARTDQEVAARSDLSAPWVMRVDWLTDVPSLRLRVARSVRAFMIRHPRRAAGAWRMVCTLQRAVARERLERGLRLLSTGRVVITDRLHGHILSLLMGLPCFLLDNSYGKLRGFYDAWTRPATNVRFCDSPEEALEAARREAESSTWL